MSLLLKSFVGTNAFVSGGTSADFEKVQAILDTANPIIEAVLE